ncbi:MAG: hypothetical protein JWR69_4316, partial [Pedosphaera sp.]|nr:hypothetical protein [Pedosphaera sp.]
YIGSNDNKFYALDGATGQKKWEFVTGNPANSPPALTADGTVYFGSNDRKLYALNTVTGNKLWEFNTGDQVDGAPNIGADGSVIFISRDSFLYSLKGTGPLAESSWPRYRRDPANTGRALLTRPVITLEQPSVTGTNTFSFQVKGLASLSARVQVSTNLIDWDHLATLPAGGADTNLFFDTQAKTVGCRFYRVVTP